MADPLFWLALSFLLVVVSLTAVLMVAIPALRELGRAARSAEKFFDTLGRELPPTLEAIRLTGLEITELTDDVTEGVQSAGQVVQQFNQGLTSAQSKAKTLNTGTKSLLAGAGAAWRAWTKDSSPRQRPQGSHSSDTRRPKLSPAAHRSSLPSAPLPTPFQRAPEANIAGKLSEGSRPQSGTESAGMAEYAAVPTDEARPETGSNRHHLPLGDDPSYTAAPDLALEEARNRGRGEAEERLAEPPPQPASRQADPKPWE